jgi:hypothetical protein
MAGAMTAGAAATGTRAYIAARHRSWATPKRLKRVTVALLIAALVASATIVVGSSPRHGRESGGSATAHR